MSFSFHRITIVATMTIVLAVCSQASAQSDDAEMRIQQLENRLRQLTGQNEELNYRNRQLEERLRMIQGGAPAAPGGQAAATQPGATSQPSAVQPSVATAPSLQPGPAYRQPAYEQPQIASPAPIVQEPVGTPPAQGRRRGDAFDPSQNPNAPGAPRALGGGQLPMPAEAPVGALGGRAPGEPLDLANTGSALNPAPAVAAPRATGAALTTLPPSASPRDEFDLGIGYMQRKDYALAEETMRNFAQKHPSDPMIADSQYWLGESYFQRQQY